VERCAHIQKVLYIERRRNGEGSSSVEEGGCERTDNGKLKQQNEKCLEPAYTLY
jgi:hypothetical protein